MPAWLGKLSWATLWPAPWAEDLLIHASLTTPIAEADNIDALFSELITAATVATAGDGTGSFEVYNNTVPGWVAGVVSTADNLTFTFNPDANLTATDNYTVYIAKTIIGSGSGRHYDGLSINFTAV